MTPWRFTLLGYKLGLAQPLFLALVPIALVIGLIVIILAIRRTTSLGKVVPSRLAAVLAPGVSTALPVLQRLSQSLSLVFFAIALAHMPERARGLRSVLFANCSCADTRPSSTFGIAIAAIIAGIAAMPSRPRLSIAYPPSIGPLTR